MIRLVILLMFCAGLARAQSSDVSPGELTLSLTVENSDIVPYVGEMVLVTIHGVYRRHITREDLRMPELDGFNWMQLGQDHWFETQVRGVKVKNMRRRMALYPVRPGDLTIGSFTHRLTLTDEGDSWFEHEIRSEPVTISVKPAPVTDGWWFPVRRLEISDQWSNAPDQLAEGEGVLRVIRVTATGASPDMIPPMPDLKSPSAMIFPHPEKRFVELSPDGPISIAFWRWTIRPTNMTSAILEPIEFDYFDTLTRQAHTVSITAQRVAMDESTLPDPVPPPDPAPQHPGLIAAVGGAGLLAGLAVMMLGQSFSQRRSLRHLPVLDPLRRALWRAARRKDTAGVRRAASAMLHRDGPNAAGSRLLSAFDSELFSSQCKAPDTRAFAAAFVATLNPKAARPSTANG